MERQILVPLDGSELSEMVLPQAMTLARATGSALTLLRVAVAPGGVEPMAWANPTPAVTQETWEAEVREARTYLDLLAHRLRETGLTVRTAVVEGDPAGVIVRYAEQTPEIRFIAMATHGRSGVSRWVFGSVAERVLHVAPVPLLLVRPQGTSTIMPPAAPFRTILVPLDGSAFAEQALSTARDLATATGATLVLMGAASPAKDTGARPPAGNQPVRMELKQLYTRYLENTAEQLQAEGLTVRIQVVVGQPAESILRVSEQVQPDLVVMATHGRSGLQQLWLGSVALKVVQGATRPVLLVRARESALGAPGVVGREPASSGRRR